MPMSFWDQQYATADFKYGTAPNAFLLQQASLIRPSGDVLVPGDGEGRNGVWLARQGHHVTAVDSSSVGMAKAQALAAEHGVSINTIVADLTEWTPAPDSVDAVVLTYVHFTPELRTAIHGRLLRALRDGGVLILEAFHPDHIGRTTFGPKDVAMLYTLQSLRDDLASVPDATFEEVVAWEGDLELDEGRGHKGTGHVVRLAARRLPRITQPQ